MFIYLFIYTKNKFFCLADVRSIYSFLFYETLVSNRKNHSPSPNVKLLTKIAKHTALGPECSIKNEPINFLAQCFENSNPSTDLQIPTFYCKAQIRVGAIHLLTHIYLCILTFDILNIHCLHPNPPPFPLSADRANKKYDKQLPGNLIYLQLTESGNGVFFCHRIRTYMFPKERNKNYLLMV
jgi:hypothetical protein